MHYEALMQARADLTGPGGDLEIIEAEVMGNRILTYKNAPPSVREVWLSTIEFATRPYLIFNDERLTYAQTHANVNAIAAWLHGQGINAGDRVAIGMRNYPEWMQIYWACVSIGVAVVGLNAWWTADELDYALNDSRPKALFVDTERLTRVREMQDQGKGITLVGVRLAEAASGVTEFNDITTAGGAMPDVAVDPDSDACIFYTSGTTGRPKGAQLTHRGCVANLMNMVFSNTSSALATQRATGVAPPEEPPIPIGLVTTPLFHVTANNCGAYLITAAGGAIVHMYRWDAGEALRIIEREGVTSVGGVPVMAREIINHPDFATTDTSTLVSMSGGGAQVPPDLVGKIDTDVETAQPVTGYGMTETCGIITSVSGDFFVNKPDSAGPAMPNFEVKCVDDDGNTVPQGELGELWVRGSSVIKGYINRPEATAESITDGWLHTGDIARIDEHGFIYIVDRKKDMVLRGGENIFCAEVETVIYQHPAVAECSVFGIPDDRLGEEVGVVIVAKSGETVDEDSVRAHCAGTMAKHKIPRYIWFETNALPRNASGKFLKRELRDRFSKQLTSS